MRRNSGRAPRVLFVTHDATLTGAPKVIEHVATYLRDSGARVSTCLGRGGPARERFRRLGPTVRVVAGPWMLRASQLPGLRALMARFALARLRVRAGRPDVVYVNTLCTHAIERAEVARRRARVVVHAHELEDAIERLGEDDLVQRLLDRSDLVLVPSRANEEVLRRRFAVPADRMVMVRECIDVAEIENASLTSSLREQLSIPSSSFVVVACGTLIRRKGTDLFVEVAHRVLGGADGDDVHFVWMGGGRDAAGAMRSEVAKVGLTEQVHVLPTTADARLHFQEFDLLALTSREDSYPLVMLEAAAAGLPAVAFESTGGAPEFIGDRAGICAPYLDVEAMADAIDTIRRDRPLYERLAGTAREQARLHDRTVIGEQIRVLLEERLGVAIRGFVPADA